MELFSPVVIAAAAFAAVCVFVFGILLVSLRHARVNRELLHDERLRAIEAGLPWDGSHPNQAAAKFMHNAFWISFWIVVGVPGAAFSAASAVTTDFRDLHLSIGIIAWIAAAVVSVAAVICATVLMVYSRYGQEESDPYATKYPKPSKNRLAT